MRTVTAPKLVFWIKLLIWCHGVKEWDGGRDAFFCFKASSVVTSCQYFPASYKLSCKLTKVSIWNFQDRISTSIWTILQILRSWHAWSCIFKLCQIVFSFTLSFASCENHTVMVRAVPDIIGGRAIPRDAIVKRLKRADTITVMRQNFIEN